MPRSTALSNGHLFVAHDSRGTVRELCWPQVGYPNHLHGHWVRLGLWIEGRFWWLDGHDVRVTMRERKSVLAYETTVLVGDTGVTVVICDWVHTACDWWIREVSLTNSSATALNVRLFQTHDLRLNETDISDTAFYNPFIKSLVHYKDDVACAFFALGEGLEINSYSCGIKNFNGLQGTWIDAEDGELSMKAIEQGTVDSTLGVFATLEAGGTRELTLACVFGKSVAAVEREHESVASLYAISGLSAPQIAEMDGEDLLYGSSARIVQAHFAVSSYGSGLVAASDSDIMTTNRANYGNVWLRDHALSCLTLIKCGMTAHVKGAIEFGLGALHADNCPLGRPKVFAQKYLPNGRLGPSWHPWVADGVAEHPWQEDESALFISLVATAYKAGLFSPQRGQWADLDAICQAVYDAVGSDDLPTESWDLWEERRGIHFFTCATVLDALNDAAYLFEVRGFTEQVGLFKLRAEKMRRAVLKQFIDGNGIARMIRRSPDGYVRDHTIDSSVLFGLLRGCFNQEVDLIKGELRRVLEDLRVGHPNGGIARYANDYYFRTHSPAPGNPWVISTLWVAQALVKLGMVSEAEPFVEWVRSKASETGMLAEQYHPETGEALSVQPLAWSHAEYLETVHAMRAKSTLPR